MYGPLMYFGPLDEPVRFCECGQSTEDCDGGCYSASLLQQTDPLTGEHPLPLGTDDYEEKNL